MLDLLAIQPLREIRRDVRPAVIRQQARSVNDGHLIEAGGRQRQIERCGDVVRLHGRTELPGDNEAREVVGTVER